MPKTKKPRLGQNFLADRHAAAKIVDALGDISDRLVVEIGPGKGALTEIVATKKSAGSASLLCALLSRAAIEKPAFGQKKKGGAGPLRHKKNPAL